MKDRPHGGFRKALETFGLALGFALVPHLPRRLVVSLAVFLGESGYLVSRRDRTLAILNLRAAYGPGKSMAWRKEIARASFRTFALMMLDLFWFSRHTADRVARYVIKDASFDRVRTTKPCILVTAHMGNWEVLGLATGMECGDVLSVASPLENPVADRVLNSVRVSTGQKIVQRQGAVRALLGWLRDGKRVALLLDQNTVPRDGGVFVDFFGLPVPVSRMPGAMHVRTGAAILPVFCTPEPGGYYRAWTLEPLARSCENCPELEATRRIMRAIEGVIRQRPGDWLWMYRRWKYLPPGGPVSGYPRYARDLRDYELSVNGRDQENWTQ